MIAIGCPICGSTTAERSLVGVRCTRCHYLHAVRAGTPKSVSRPATVQPEIDPNYTPKSYLTLSAGPDLQLDGCGTPTGTERDPLTPDLLAELIPENEHRALWGDR